MPLTLHEIPQPDLFRNPLIREFMVYGPESVQELLSDPGLPKLNTVECNGDDHRDT